MVETALPSTRAGWRAQARGASMGARAWFSLITGLVILLCFGLGARPDARFQLSGFGAALSLPDLVVPVRPVAVVGSVLAILGAGYLALRDPSRRRATWALAVVVSCFVASFLCWAVAGRSMSLAGLMGATAVGSLPLLLGALAGVMCERAGVINVAIEAQFILGAFAASVFGSLGGIWIGMASGSLAGGLVGGLLGVCAIRYLADQVVIGIVLTLLVQGLTGFLLIRVVIPNAETLHDPDVMGDVRIPWLADIPVVGEALFDQTVIWYLAIAMLVVIQVALFRTRWGLRVQAVGENPDAAESAGIDVRRVRYHNVLLGGLIAGLGGTFLTIGSVGQFAPGISAGKGFIALAAVIFGGWRPLAAFGAALLFGLADATQSILSVIGSPIPSEVLQIFPYVVTILALAGLVGRVRPPAADGKPFVRA